jgi:hypothetical protein
MQFTLYKKNPPPGLKYSGLPTSNTAPPALRTIPPPNPPSTLHAPACLPIESKCVLFQVAPTVIPSTSPRLECIPRSILRHSIWKRSDNSGCRVEVRLGHAYITYSKLSHSGTLCGSVLDRQIQVMLTGTCTATLERSHSTHRIASIPTSSTS